MSEKLCETLQKVLRVSTDIMLIEYIERFHGDIAPGLENR
jgi:hypothetical protein